MTWCDASPGMGKVMDDPVRSTRQNDSGPLRRPPVNSRSLVSSIIIQNPVNVTGSAGTASSMAFRNLRLATRPEHPSGLSLERGKERRDPMVHIVVRPPFDRAARPRSERLAIERPRQHRLHCSIRDPERVPSTGLVEQPVEGDTRPFTDGDPTICACEHTRPSSKSHAGSDACPGLALPARQTRGYREV